MAIIRRATNWVAPLSGAALLFLAFQRLVLAVVLKGCLGHHCQTDTGKNILQHGVISFQGICSSVAVLEKLIQPRFHCLYPSCRSASKVGITTLWAGEVPVDALHQAITGGQRGFLPATSLTDKGLWGRRYRHAVTLRLSSRVECARMGRQRVSRGWPGFLCWCR